MNYETASDFEINKKLALLTGLLVAEFDDNSKLGMNTRYHELYPNTIWAAKTDDHGKQCEAWEQVIYTNEWADIGPLIEAYNVTLAKHVNLDSWEAFAGGYVVNYDHNIESHIDIEYEHINPKRAAAICIIKLLSK